MIKALRTAMERQAWDKMRTRAQIHWQDLVPLGIAKSTARTFVKRWHDAGMLEALPMGADGRKLYRPAQSASQAPAMQAAPVAYDSSPEGNMWRAMRSLRQFSPIDLSAHATAGGIEVSAQKARAYCRMLLLSEHVQIAKSGVPGKREPIYRIARYSGPVAPKRREIAGVYDLNTGEFVSLDREVTL